MSSKLKDYSHKVQELHNKVREIHQAHYDFDDIIGKSREIDKVKGMALRVAAGDAPVLILGESGSGKELFAHAIHKASPRNTNPFVAINCSAFPPHLLSSELFGYEEGAFTGAAKGGKLGLFELAHGGTLFLDEIGDMEIDLQAKLLRILETGEFMRIGGTKPIKVDVRIVSATNKDLEKLIRETKYREDLFYRLNVIALRVPSLRMRLEDIPVLVEYHLDRLGAKMNRNFTASEEALAILGQYNYPGNVRELFNILEFAANTCETQMIMPSDLPIFSKIKYLPEPQGVLSSTRRTSEKEAIQEALKNYGTSVEGKRRAARHLGISLATLYNKIGSMGSEYAPPSSAPVGDHGSRTSIPRIIPLNPPFGFKGQAGGSLLRNVRINPAKKRGPTRAPSSLLINRFPVFTQKLGSGRTPVARQKSVITSVVEKAHQKMNRW